MAEEIEKGLWRLEIPLIGNPLKSLNSYLIVGDDRSLLIDTGFRQDSCREAMESQLREIGVNRSRMDIFLTHLHSDHTGLAPELLRGNGQIYVGAIDGPGIIEGLSDDYWKRVYASYLKNGFSREEVDRLWNSNPAQEAAPETWSKHSRYLEDGDCISYGGHRLQCILTPGHTPGHLCLYDAEYQWLFSGDHVLFHITPNICRWMSMPDALGSYLDSLNKIRDLPVRRLLPAHRAESGILSRRVDELKEHHARRAENAWQTIKSEPGLNAYEIAGRMSWNIRSRNWEEFPLTQKFFAIGETLAHLDHLVLRGKAYCWEENGIFLYGPAGPISASQK
jgi:glyoxylase-like metal-dependent hydrolase (beta-lactamase superfamily II)